MAIAGLSETAQAFFDQGLTQLHGFWYFESERSFRQVAMLHPDCAMAYWGMTMCNPESPERAAGFIAGAVQRSTDAPRFDQLWIDAWAAYYQIDDAARAELRSGDAARVKAVTEALAKKNKVREQATKEKLDRQLLKDMGTIVYEFPADTEAKALLAVQIWHAYAWGSGIGIVSHAAVDALLDQVFTKAPGHPAHHYRVHLWDREDAQRALRSAAALGDSAQGIAHQWHMAGHIYAKLHRHAEAAWQQMASGRVDHAHMRRDRVMPFLIHNYGHNQEWLSRSLSYQGRVSEALAVARNLAELPRHPKWSNVKTGDDIAGYARERLVTLCEDFGLWATALELADAGVLDVTEGAKPEVARLGLLARALFRLGRVPEAEQLVAQVDALLPKARAERARALDEAEDKARAAGDDRKKTDDALGVASRTSTDVVRAVFDVQRELKGEHLLAQGDAKAALAEFAALPSFPKTLLADAHLAAGEADKAVEVLAKEVEREPHRLQTTARLLIAYRATGKPEHAEKAKALSQEVADALAWPGCATSDLGQRVMPKIEAGVTARPLPTGETAGFGADFGTRPPLASLGPAGWSPMRAVGFDLPVAGGGRRTLAPGKPTLVVFYLGFGCLHCVEQLQAIAPKAAAFADAGIDIVAIGTDTADKAAESLAALPAPARFGFPLLADPDLATFKAWRCYDDFEGMPLHGTFLVDAAGDVRWQDISFQPFTEIDWLVAESRRLLALPAHAGAGAK